MKLHCCSFASDSFYEVQKKQKNSFLNLGFKPQQMHLYNPEKLGNQFFYSFPKASEMNRYGWFAFKPFFLKSILDEIEDNDILIYLDVNDKPLEGLQSYILKTFKKNKDLDILAPLTNYPNFNFLSNFHKNNLSIELLISSLFNCQPEAGALIIRNSTRSRLILNTWYQITLLHAYELEKYCELKTRCDQETLFILSRIYKSIKLESWFLYKLKGIGLRSFIAFENFRP